MQIPNIFTSFSPNFFFWQFFSWNQSCQQLKSPKPQHFHEFFIPKKIDIFFGKSKFNFWTKNEDFEQCAKLDKMSKMALIGQSGQCGPCCWILAGKKYFISFWTKKNYIQDCFQTYVRCKYLSSINTWTNSFYSVTRSSSKSTFACATNLITRLETVGSISAISIVSAICKRKQDSKLLSFSNKSRK